MSRMEVVLWKRKKERKFKSCFSFGLCTSGSLQHDHSPTFVSPVWVFLLRSASFLSYTRMHWVMCTAAGVEFWSFLSRVGVSVNVSEDDPLSSSSISGRAVECCHSLVFSGHCRLLIAAVTISQFTLYRIVCWGEFAGYSSSSTVFCCNAAHKRLFFTCQRAITAPTVWLHHIHLISLLMGVFDRW